LLRVPARRAFGTGSHATTALVLLILEDLANGAGEPCAQIAGESVSRPALSDMRVLDLGCGSGVLALAARKLDARTAIAFDVDRTAVFLARNNGALNNETLALFVGSIAAISTRPAFDLVLVNVLPENLDGQEAAIAAVLDTRGLLVVSGLLAARESEILARWNRLGLHLRGRRTLDEWVALVLSRDSPERPHWRLAREPASFRARDRS
jgi:ribosomal protein L11 methyltransferase